ncbi:MAG TPA: saccharopine dehydrogenase NADP-binding domain-containing protein [Anaerolineales bacterium]|nr:saccharopine dehydrogenase NADP-binding domain-containing protein [Anaerolineales bacterium]
MKTGKILVVGGYGYVGRTISIILASQFPSRVIGAGRDIRKAEKLSQETSGKVLPLALDVFDPDANIEKVLEGVSLVIMCLDQPDTRIIEQIIQKGVDYIDATATSGFLASLEKFDGLAKESGSSVVLSVGLEPGLTNLLAAYAAKALDIVHHIDIFVMLGMGDAHGDAAIRWTLENIDTEFTVLEKGSEKSVRSFEDAKRTMLPGIGERTAYRFDFPDQHSLPKTLGVDSLSSRLCFDIESVTNIFAALKAMGILRILRCKRARDLAVKFLKNMHFGTDQFVLKVEASGRKKGEDMRIDTTIRGTGEAHQTGLVAAEVARRLYSDGGPVGVFHIEQLFEPQEFIHSIDGITFLPGVEQ